MPTDQSPPPDTRDAAQTLDDLEELLKRIPGAQKVINELRDLRALLVGRRAPRVAVLGRRGSGKSSLANALLGRELLAVGAVEDTTAAPAWIDLAVQGRQVRWLDTPGLRAGARPERREAVAKALRSERPDVLLWLFKASQVDAGVDEDLAELVALRASISGPDRPVPVVVVMTKVDELPPTERRAPPYEGDAEKRASIEQAKEVLRGHVQRVTGAELPVVPVCTWQRFAEGAVATDWRWNLDALAMEIHKGLPVSAQIEAARAFERARSVRRKVAMRLVGTATSVSFVVGATPLPIADLAVLIPLQSSMLTGIVYASGRSLGPRAVSEWLAVLGASVGAGVGLREAVRAALKLVPGVGATISGAVAATGTWALGVAAVRYFIDGVSVQEARAAFSQAAEEGPPSDITRPDEE
ncbi:MAG: 50S ribosome-binding GTPase [Deltaproteobacteria bacterium]|nr:50S ribosome-binding GTPase [Deltaproteobacteria bacterium]MBK8693150.1 50S ribosome-binding GTPase [Deltaproteobacteria bacterium]